MTVCKSIPRRCASVHTALNPVCNPAMPPHASPRFAVLAHLQREGRRRVVADDSINGAIQQSIPESILVLTAADRRTALELTRSVRNLLCGERQVVRAGFNGDANAVGFGLTDVGERVRIGEMNDVSTPARPSARFDDRRDG